MAQVLEGLITFEGGEGCGKTTQIQLLSEYLRGRGVKHIVTREPGGSPFAEEVRKVLLSGEGVSDALNEYLLLTAARREHLNTVIRPALDRGDIVLCDRFVHSTFVYQCCVKGMDEELFYQLNDLLLGVYMPELTLYLDVTVEVGQRRVALRSDNDRNVYDDQNLEFHEKLRSAYLDIVDNKRFVKIDASGGIDQVSGDIIEVVDNRL